MRKVIANAIYKVNDSYKGVNVTVSTKKNIDIYLKNSFVSLYSAKVNNPDVDVILIINYAIDYEIEQLFKQHEIQIIKLQEVTFKFPSDFKWTPAFYKLDALKYLSRYYDLVCVMDTDTIVVDKCEYMWKEAENALLVFDVDYSLESPKRKITKEIASGLFKINDNINHWGGEIIVGTSKDVSNVIHQCEKIYNKLINNLNVINKGFGQEALLSIALYNYGARIERANKYCNRYWTRRIYLVDTNYMNIPIWHLPAEKDAGLLKVFNLLIKCNKIPNKIKLSKIFFLKRKMKMYESFFYHFMRILIKLKSGQKINFRKTAGWIDK